MTDNWFNLIEKDNMATEPTEEHEIISGNAFIFPCPSVGSVAIK